MKYSVNTMCVCVCVQRHPFNSTVHASKLMTLHCRICSIASASVVQSSVVLVMMMGNVSSVLLHSEHLLIYIYKLTNTTFSGQICDGFFSISIL